MGKIIEAEDYKGSWVTDCIGPKVVLKFYNPHCPPCKMLATTIEAVIDDIDVVIVNINTDNEEYSADAAEYGIRSIPKLLNITLNEYDDVLNFYNGNITNKDELSDWLKG